MKKTTLTMIAAVAAISAGLGVAQAQGRGPSGDALVFEELDVDGSGEITLEDLEARKDSRFAEIDTDGNGSISEAEFMAHAEGRAGERAAEMFARLDADGDGELSRDVLESRSGRGSGEQMISRLDTDNSGGVSAEELEAGKERMANRGGGKRGGGEGRGGKGHSHN